MVRQEVKRILRAVGLLGVAQQVAARRREAAHKRKMHAFYRQFIAPGDLCFDIGANVGSRTAVFLALGARVVSVEPQDDCITQLRTHFGRDSRVALVHGGVADREGELEIYISQPNPTSSMSKEWIEKLKSRPGWEAHTWYKTQIVPVTTLDQLIAKHGRPAFIKIDVEGFELPVLRGLSAPVAALSFEYSPEDLSAASACMDYLQSLGPYRFNASYKESMDWMLPDWTEAGIVRHALDSLPVKTRSGDVYARLTP